MYDWVILLYMVYGLLDMFGIRQMGSYDDAAVVISTAGYMLVCLGIGIMTGQVELVRVRRTNPNCRRR
jgi:hypothetical protein